MNLLWMVVVAGTLQVIRCGRDEAKGRIIVGSKASAYTYPMYALMTGLDAGDTEEFQWCSGSILSRRHVMTAAHCIPIGEPAYENVTFYVYVGKTKISASGKFIGEQRVRVKRTAAHKKFFAPNNTNNEYDIAILQLESPLTFTETVQPVKLSDPLFDKDSYSNDECYMAGFGATGYRRYPDFRVGEEKSTNVLLDTKVVVAPISVCNYIIDYSLYAFLKLSKRLICTATPGANSSCYGDSGAAVLCKDPKGKLRQVAIVSYGIDGYCQWGISGNTRVSILRTWIARTLARL